MCGHSSWTLAPSNVPILRLKNVKRYRVHLVPHGMQNTKYQVLWNDEMQNTKIFMGVFRSIQNAKIFAYMKLLFWALEAKIQNAKNFGWCLVPFCRMVGQNSKFFGPNEELNRPIVFFCMLQHYRAIQTYTCRIIAS